MNKDEPQTTHGYGCWSWGPAHYLCAINHIHNMPKQYKYIDYIREHGYSYIERNVKDEVSTIWAFKTGRDTDMEDVLTALAQAINKKENP